MTLFRSFPVLELELTKRYGKLYGLFSGHIPVLTINDPNLIRVVLIKDFHLFANRRKFNTKHEILDNNVLYARDDNWKRMRSISSNIFSNVKLKTIYPLLSSCVHDLIDILKVLAINGQDINLKELCGNLSMDVIAKCAFATQIDAYKDQNNPFIINAQKIFHPKLYKLIAGFVFPKCLLRVLNITTVFDDNANRFFFSISRELIKKRRLNSEIHNDLFQLFINQENEINDQNNDNNCNEKQNKCKEYLDSDLDKVLTNSEKSIKTKTCLTDTEIISQSWLFLLAGYETVSTSLTFCLYELALNVEVQEKLYSEIQLAIDENGHFDYENLSTLPYLDAVISESLRLYPAFIRVEREAKQDYQFTDSDIKLKAGQLIHVSIYGVQHNEEFFPEAEKFIPERFLPENKHKIVPYSYLPFGVGPRNCVGLRLALMEMKVCVANVINQFRLNASKRTDIPPRYMTNTHVCVAEPLFISIKSR
ncbi:cytochrome P450 3A8-like [Oppia nitens]|uniref:cytochrome P450 3A8-like n=1 Tax=Oppia nitens TaxID=1686743 RepID=UPI0023DC388A|nr:cytochrome P450 3A8-like [Oppia nitens]